MTMPIRVEDDIYSPSRWDHTVVAMANLILKLATPRYRRLVQNTYAYGVAAAARDIKEGIEPPKHWSHYANCEESS